MLYRATCTELRARHRQRAAFGVQCKRLSRGAKRGEHTTLVSDLLQVERTLRSLLQLERRVQTLLGGSPANAVSALEVNPAHFAGDQLTR